MFAPGKRRVTVYLVFQGSAAGGPWTLFCSQAWRHCLMLVAIYHPWPHAFARRYTMLVEPTAWGLHLDVLWQAPDEVAATYYQQGATAIVKQTVNLPPNRLFAIRGVISCVSVLKAALGIKNWRILTPYGLFAYLLRSGAELVTWEAENADSRAVVRGRDCDGQAGRSGPCGDASADGTATALAGAGSQGGA